MNPPKGQSEESRIIIHDDAAQRWLQFQAPIQVVTTQRVDEVLERMREVEQAVNQRGLHAAGWVAYEAAPAFDSALSTHPPSSFPLLWFGLYEKPEVFSLPEVENAPLPANEGWKASLSPEAYQKAFNRIKTHIREGDTYQVNFTHRLTRDSFKHDPWQTFLHLIAAQRTRYGAYAAAGPWRICSASPELFFRLDGTHLESRPMKGTAPRGLTTAQDRLQAEALLASGKNRAENLMIVDMVRNDMGRIARPGTVETPRLCDLEKYPTLWQLTSTVTAKTEASVIDLFQAMFPPASITGAPKARTMQLISELESTPRQIYTGAIGFLSPGRHAQFNVAIRTLLIDTKKSCAEYGVGGGLVWDSDCEHEQAECRTKARVLMEPRAPFSLLETLLWTPKDGFHLLERHLKRLHESAEYFDFALDEPHLREQLKALIHTLSPDAHRIRLLLAENGKITLQSTPLPPSESAPPLRATLARHPVDTQNPFLYHKTTNRRLYEDTKAEAPDIDDVILFNEKNEVTETTIANLAVEVDGHLCTPPIECGLLPGTERAELLENGILREKIITLEQLLESPRIFRLNSVRGMEPITVSAGS